MKSCAQYIAEAKAKLGDPRMSDRGLGVNLGRFHDGGFSQQDVSRAKKGPMTDPMAIAIAKALAIEPGEVLWAARLERESRPEVRQHLERWGHVVGKALASLPSKVASAVAALAMAMSLFQPAPNAQVACGGEGR
jgi:hypothetical protein